MTYAVKEENNPSTGKQEYVVVDSNGAKAPDPNTFATKDAAVGRIAELLKARQPSPGKLCHGKIIAASDMLFIQHIGMGQYVIYQRVDSLAFEKIEVDDLVEIIDGEVKYPEQIQGLCR